MHSSCRVCIQAVGCAFKIRRVLIQDVDPSLVSTYVVCERLSVIQQQVCLVDFLSVTLSLSDLVFCAFTDVAGSLSQSDLVFCAFTDVTGSLSQSDLVFCAFTDVACG